MNVREGDPILAPGGESIVAYWACGMDLNGSNSVVFAMMRGLAAVGMFDEPTPIVHQSVQIFHVQSFPDRSYWVVEFGAPSGWEQLKWFDRVAPKPSAEPSGMVAAYDLVIADNADRPAWEVEMFKAKHEFWKRKSTHGG